MTFSQLPALISPPIAQWVKRPALRRLVLMFLATLSCLVMLGQPPALAALNDDRYDGEIFTLYAGNGSLVPPKFTLDDSLQRKRPILLVLYVDDSSDCKQYTTVVSRLQAFYGRAADFLPIRVDSIPAKASYQPNEPGYYYTGSVPQTVVFNAAGKVVLNEKGVTAFEKIDDKFREVFDLLPRSESTELRRRPLNEVNTELTQ